MEFDDVVRARRMWRNFEERAIDPAALDRILDAAARAPSAGFTQGWAFLVLEDDADRARFWELAWPPAERTGPVSEGLLRAPAIIVPLSSREQYLDRYAEPDKGWTDRDPDRWPIPYWHIDTGFASMLILLAVVNEGLGALFFGVRNVDGLRATFGFPDDHTPIGAIAIGHPLPDPRSPSLRRGRKPAAQIVHRGRW